MNRGKQALLGALVAGLAVATMSHSADAQPLKLCGGNNDHKVVPAGGTLTCYNTKTIDGTEITVVLEVTDTTVTAHFSLAAPRAVDTPVRVVSNKGISSTAKESDVEGVIPAGFTELSVSVVLRCGQIDTKAVFIGNGEAAGRVAAPWVQNSTNCVKVVDTTTTTTVTTPGQVVTTTPTTAATSVRTGTLPETGNNDALVYLVAVMVLGGTVLCIYGVRRQSA